MFYRWLFLHPLLLQVREALQHVPGKYEDFLRVIYEFETGADKRTAVDLYSTLRKLLHEWPQLLTDFAAFLLPEQALECGLVGRTELNRPVLSKRCKRLWERRN